MLNFIALLTGESDCVSEKQNTPVKETRPTVTITRDLFVRYLIVKNAIKL